MNMQERINLYQQQGLLVVDATSKVCGEIILSKIAKTSNRENVTIKGGFVIMDISKDLRRATRDLDLDFIKYSLSEESIIKFIDRLNEVDHEIKLEINLPILELKHQDYKGKRVNLLMITDDNKKYDFALDIGVHTNLKLDQEEYCFDFNNDGAESVNLLINSKEQIFAEKLKSLLRMGAISGRYKDIFDMYYLIKINPVNKNKLISLIVDYVLNDEDMFENSFSDIQNRLSKIFNNKRYIKSLDIARDNWLELPVKEVLQEIINFFDSIETIYG